MNRLHALAAALFVAAIGLSIATSGTADESGIERSASIYDEGPSGTAVLRRYLEGLGARVTSIQGDRFLPRLGAPDAGRPGTLFVLGATDSFGAAEIATLREFVSEGGTLVVATDLAVNERGLLGAFGIARAGAAARRGEHQTSGIALAAPPVRRIAIDVGIELAPGPSGYALVRGDRAALVAMVREGRGVVFAVGSLAPFLNATIGEADNGRLALALSGLAAVAGREIGFDEYHHGVRPQPNPFAVLVATWPGRALLIASAAIFLYLLLSGRRLGPSVPLDPRPPRSSLEYIRGFAGLVRRSGHGEIARRRLRDDLRHSLARRAGMDPAAPFDRIASVLWPRSPARAAEARALDAALARRMRDDELLRSVARIDRLVRADEEASA